MIWSISMFFEGVFHFYSHFANLTSTAGQVSGTNSGYCENPKSGEGGIVTLNLEDLSREDLVGVAKLYSNLVRALDGFWYLAVMDRMGNELALECDIATWQGMIKYELDRITRQFDIQGNDLRTLFRALRFEPMFGETDYDVEFIGDSEAVMTVTACAVLKALEKGKSGREAQICGVVEPIIMKCYTSYFNPAIVSEALEIPPREHRDGICCRWRFSIPESD